MIFPSDISSLIAEHRGSGVTSPDSRSTHSEDAMRPDIEAKEEAVRKAREHVMDVMRRHSDDPRSKQLIAEALRDAETALTAARADLREAERSASNA